MAAYVEMSDRKAFDGPCYALHHEPRRLDEDEGSSEPVAFTFVLNFRFGRHDERVDIVAHKNTRE